MPRAPKVTPIIHRSSSQRWKGPTGHSGRAFFVANTREERPDPANSMQKRSFVGWKTAKRFPRGQPPEPDAGMRLRSHPPYVFNASA